MRNALVFTIMLVLLAAMPALAQNGSNGGPGGPETSEGGGVAGCWNCVDDPGFNIGCGSDTHCEYAGDNQAGSGTYCEQWEPVTEGCHLCSTSGNACYNIVVHG